MFISWLFLTFSLLSTIVSSYKISTFSIRQQNIQKVRKYSLNAQSDQDLVIDQNVIEQPLLLGMAGFTAVGSAISSRISAANGEDNLQKKFFIETHGCQMNLADSDVVRSVLLTAGYEMCDILEDADLILTNTCAIRENAEAKIWQRLKYFASLRKKGKKEGTKPAGYPIVGVLGCMAERLKSRLLDDSGVDFIAGPDAYRELPNLLMAATTDQSAANTQLSLEETYADITPVRLAEGNTHAFVTITRGCNNHCAFCIVPYTRGKERSRPVESVLNEVRALRDQGVKEVVLLGQNVNSFWDESSESSNEWQQQQEKYSLDKEPYVYTVAPGFTQRKKIVSRGTESNHIDKSGDNDSKGEHTHSKEGSGSEKGVRFAELLSLVAAIDPDNMRIRFQSPHPKDFPDEVLRLVADTPNICNSLHMPAQHGNSEALERMKRGYSREAYLSLVERARSIIGEGSPEGVGLGLSSDFISGFCGETEEEHKETVSLMASVGFDQAFTYAYSRRDQTFAGLFLTDDVPDDVKSRRLTELVDTFQATSMAKNNRLEIGRLHVVLVEGKGKKMMNIPPSSVDTQYSQPSGTSNDTKASWTGTDVRILTTSNFCGE
mmetsp:Transcript_28805/g.27590  ORF Transcript_28805/g.27590 Transcript_28805/m.27590 type:complete len:605 (+) Transcript_28805:125-1939(+)